MSAKSVELNERYIAELYNASESEVVMARVRNLWWKSFLRRFQIDQLNALDNLDLAMDDGREKLNKMASNYAQEMGFSPNTPQFTQRVSQFLKSNTGKMFERFVGLTIAHALKEADAPYCILPFRGSTLRLCHGSERDWFSVAVNLGDKPLTTAIDADLIAFNPEDESADVFLISIKSTLKDRFHAVPFWNLLRNVAVSRAMGNVTASKTNFLKKLRYIVICSDLAEEQPDFSAEGGPRNLIALDAALLDGAYVSASKAKGLGDDDNHLGPTRRSAFYPLSKFYRHLTK